MLTITKLARTCRVSRATLLYYEKEGLLQPAMRSDKGYRYYGQDQQQRLQRILQFRGFGLSTRDIRLLLHKGDDSRIEQLLLQQLSVLDQQIERLRQQQLAIIRFLQLSETSEDNMMTKQRWSEIMRASGMDDEAMWNWHRQFEQMEPGAHQEFLESLNIPPTEIADIRSRCQA